MEIVYIKRTPLLLEVQLILTEKSYGAGTAKKEEILKKNLKRNFGCPNPEGYRKALRLMRMANRFEMPIISFVDTPGAFPGIEAEERHVAEAIAVNLREMATFNVPIIVVVIGEVDQEVLLESPLRIML